MTNGIAISLIAPFMAVNIGILIKLLFVDRRKNRDIVLMYLLGACMALLVWQINNLIYFLTNDYSVLRLTYDLKLSFSSLTALFMMLLIIRFYRVDYYLNRTVIMIALIIPCFTFLYSIVASNTDLIRETFSVVQTSPIHQVISTRGIWFWVSRFGFYTFLSIGTIVSFYCHNKLPRTYRAPSYTLMGGFLLVIIVSVFQLVVTNNQGFDFSLIGACMSLIAIYFSVVKGKGVDFITNARNEIYDYLSEGIIILNDERYVVYVNRSAREKIEGLGLKVMNRQYDEVFEQAVSYSSNIEAAPANEDGLDMAFMNKGREIIFNLSEKPIKDNWGMPIGTFVVLDEVTDNRAIINKLENIGGIDALTGLPNRRSIEKFIMNTDSKDKYPIAVIAGDINGLKHVNDNLGHKQGDVLIRLVSEIMTDVCPLRGRVSRIGGDEFLIIIPNSSEDEIKIVISEMNDIIDSNRDYQFQPSVSFGYALKTAENMNMTDVISLADQRMYEIKAAGKNAEGSAN